jgi:hypothetical protein
MQPTIAHWIIIFLLFEGCAYWRADFFTPKDAENRKELMIKRFLFFNAYVIIGIAAVLVYRFITQDVPSAQPRVTPNAITSRSPAPSEVIATPSPTPVETTPKPAPTPRPTYTPHPTTFPHQQLRSTAPMVPVGKTTTAAKVKGEALR